MTTDERDRLGAFALRVWSYKQGEVVSLMIHLGDRLGLYRAMTGRGPMTAAGLAVATGLQERWLLEWLRGQAAAGLIGTEDGEAFELSAEAVAVLADNRQSLWFAAGAFAGGAAPPEVVERLAGAFGSGIGLTYDDLGPAATQAIERMTEPWTRLALVPLILPALDGVVDRLQAGARVADVGCGSGVAVCTMAAAFLGSRFEGLDPSQHAIGRARRRAAENGLENVEFRAAGAEDLPDDSRYDFVMTLDCLHDMPRPAQAAAAIRRAVRPDGTWLIKDIRSGPAWQDNLRNPVLALMYGLSVTSCLSSGLSEPGGAGLGTLGLHPGLAERMCREAGFSRFVRHDFDDPVNLYYEVRP
jgi:2-polyprenyl-3-methyl-5-hydroxy-6-metoxy-1,4-benzoquinol methylase